MEGCVDIVLSAIKFGPSGNCAQLSEHVGEVFARILFMEGQVLFSGSAMTWLFGVLSDKIGVKTLVIAGSIVMLLSALGLLLLQK